MGESPAVHLGWSTQLSESQPPRAEAHEHTLGRLSSLPSQARGLKSSTVGVPRRNTARGLGHREIYLLELARAMMEPADRTPREEPPLQFKFKAVCWEDSLLLGGGQSSCSPGLRLIR